MGCLTLLAAAGGPDLHARCPHSVVGYRRPSGAEGLYVALMAGSMQNRESGLRRKPLLPASVNKSAP
jgi:hypothetical protein